MEWTQDRPTKPGRYLRNNPPCSFVVPADIVDIDGVLWNARCNVGDGMRRLDHHAEWFWWYGPIPDPPWFAEEEIPA